MNSKTSDRPSDPSPAPVGDVREALQALSYCRDFVSDIVGGATIDARAIENATEIRNEALTALETVEAALIAEVEAKAWVVFAENGDIRIWFGYKGAADHYAAKHNAIITPLYARPPVPIAAPTTPATSRDREAREALEFYADPRRYRGANQRAIENDPFGRPDAFYIQDVTRDNGDVARAALQALGGDHE